MEQYQIQILTKSFIVTKCCIIESTANVRVVLLLKQETRKTGWAPSQEWSGEGDD